MVRTVWIADCELQAYLTRLELEDFNDSNVRFVYVSSQKFQKKKIVKKNENGNIAKN